MQQRASNDQICANCHKLQQEIVRLKEELAVMEQHAYFDALTGLSNRRFFVDNLEARISRCQRYGDNSALLFLDVDGLKAVNDAHGHGAGDAQLKRLAELLTTYTRTSDVVARIGGDEFGILLDNLDSDQVVDKIDFLMNQISGSKSSFNGKQSPLGASIGYCFVGPKDTVESLMSRADAAMYRAKDKSE